MLRKNDSQRLLSFLYGTVGPLVTSSLNDVCTVLRVLAKSMRGRLEQRPRGQQEFIGAEAGRIYFILPVGAETNRSRQKDKIHRLETSLRRKLQNRKELRRMSTSDERIVV